MISETMSAYEIGWMYAELGKTLKDNPFHRESGGWLAYRNGWREFWGLI